MDDCEKLKAFCEGLEMENVEELMKKSPEFFRVVGKTMSNRIKGLPDNIQIKEIIQRLKDCKTPYGLGSQWYDNDRINDLIKDLESIKGE